MANTYDDAVLIDGLVIANFSRAIFEDMVKGGITAANCTCCVWHDFRATMANIAQWKRWFAEHDDLILQVHSTADIRRAKQESKVGIILGWQNTSAIGTDIRNLQLFHELGEVKYRPCPLLRKLVRAGRLGVKTRHGFFEYDEDGRRLGKPASF